MLTFLLFLVGCTQEQLAPESKEEKNDLRKVCVTVGYRDLTESSITLSGYANLTIDMTGAIKLGIVCSTKSIPDQSNGKSRTTTELNVDNQFFVSFSGLENETKYYYRAFVLRNEV